MHFLFTFRGAGTGGLGLTIEGASEAKISCKDNKDGSCSVEYIPFTPGDYDVNINYGGQPIPGSPFRVPVRDPVDPSKVKCSGPGLGSGVRAHVPQTFMVDCSQAGQAPLDVKLYGPSGELLSCLQLGYLIKICCPTPNFNNTLSLVLMPSCYCLPN